MNEQGTELAKWTQSQRRGPKQKNQQEEEIDGMSMMRKMVQDDNQCQTPPFLLRIIVTDDDVSRTILLGSARDCGVERPYNYQAV